MTDNEDWPFDAWLKIAVMQLGLSAEAFWKMSLIDWFALARNTAPSAMHKEDLIKLEMDYEHAG